MRKHAAILLIPTALILALVSSCSKTEEPENLGTRITGKWKKIKYATDDNLNGKIDSWEINAVEGNVNNEITFNKDNTGTEVDTYVPAINFRWNIAGGDTLVLTRAGNNTVTYQVESVNSSILDLVRITSLGLAWYEYKKQE
jgi:hypothetical protein